MAQRYDVQILPKIPVRIDPGLAIDVASTGGVRTISLDLSELANNTLPDPDTNYLPIVTAAGVHAKMPLSIVYAQGTTEIGIYRTRHVAEDAEIPETALYVQTYGFASVGDDGAAIYIPGASLTDGGFQSADGRFWDLVGTPVYLEQFGAVPGGVTDCTAALNEALSLGRTIDGRRKTFAVTGDILLPENAYIMSARFKQLSPNNTSRRTLYANGVDGITLIDVVVDRNGSGSEGALATAAGIWIQGGSRHILSGVEVFGPSMGSGVSVQSATDIQIRNPYMHDLTYALATSPGDDRVQGIWMSACSDFDIINPRIEDMGGTVGGGAFNAIWTRALIIGLGSHDFTIMGGTIRRVDQGLDLTGSEGCWNFRIIGVRVEYCQTYGFKNANFNRYGSIISCTAYRAGSIGFIFSGPSSDPDTPAANMPILVTVSDCQAIDTGYENTGRGTSTPTGFAVFPSTYFTDYPRGIVFDNCRAIDTQTVKTQYYGFRNEVSFGGPPASEARNCTVDGLAVGGASFSGFPYPACSIGRSSDQSHASSGSFVDVLFNSETFDGMSMHSTVSNPELVVILKDGFYNVDAYVGFDSNGTGNRQSQILVNGSVILSTLSTMVATASVSNILRSSTLQYFKVNDTIRVQAFQNSGGALNIRANETRMIVQLANPYGAA